jgi:hypothetical protein
MKREGNAKQSCPGPRENDPGLRKCHFYMRGNDFLVRKCHFYMRENDFLVRKCHFYMRGNDKMKKKENIEHRTRNPEKRISKERQSFKGFLHIYTHTLFSASPLSAPRAAGFDIRYSSFFFSLLFFFLCAIILHGADG